MILISRPSTVLPTSIEGDGHGVGHFLADLRIGAGKGQKSANLDRFSAKGDSKGENNKKTETSRNNAIYHSVVPPS